MLLASLILAVHVAIIAFNLIGLFVIPVGAHYGWAWVRAPLWRALHLVSWGAVALQALAGRACFLTIWQHDLAGTEAAATPLIMRWVNALIFWPLPMWVFTALYVAALAYALALLWLVPPRPMAKRLA